MLCLVVGHAEEWVFLVENKPEEVRPSPWQDLTDHTKRFYIVALSAGNLMLMGRCSLALSLETGQRLDKGLGFALLGLP